MPSPGCALAPQFMSAQNVASSINTGGVQSSMSTLDESVADTLKRDVRRCVLVFTRVSLPVSPALWHNPHFPG